MLPDPSYEPHNDALERVLLLLGLPCGTALFFFAWWMWPSSIEQDPVFVLASIVAALAGALLIWNVVTCLLAHIATSRFLPRLVASGIAAIIQRIGTPAARQILARRSATAALAMALVGGGQSAMASPLSPTPPSPPHPDHTQSAPSHIYEEAPIPDNLQWPLPSGEVSPGGPTGPSAPAVPSPGAEPNPLDIPSSPSSSHEGGSPTVPTETPVPTDAPAPAPQPGRSATESNPEVATPPPVPSAAPPALQVEDLQPQEPNPLEVPARNTPAPSAEVPGPEAPAPHAAAPPPRHIDIADPAVTLPGDPDPTRIPEPAASAQSAQSPASTASAEEIGTWAQQSFTSLVEMISTPEEKAPSAPASGDSAPPQQGSDTPPQAPTVTVPATPSSQAEHTVREGESLWSISEDVLGPQASEAEIADAWPRIYEENREVIGDSPDLIHPGDILTVPKELT
ncbi:MAG: LysM peptidoglycan-binding domain-containing protein [Actinomycetaceae bacterium]|nr:LysM peptidoglycan-binding domain-containing protein [Actinomycetaceae bacterium]